MLPDLTVWDFADFWKLCGFDGIVQFAPSIKNDCSELCRAIVNTFSLLLLVIFSLPEVPDHVSSLFGTAFAFML